MTAAVWTAMVALLAGFELVALVDRRPRNTWSYWVWAHVRAYLAARLIGYPLWTWLSWHWLIESEHQGWGDDLAAVAVGVVLALVATTRRGHEGSR